MKKKILFLILCMFVVTVKASENKELCWISAPESQAGLYAERRGDDRSLDERLKSLGMSVGFKNVKLTLLNPKVISLSKSDPNKSIQLLELKKDKSQIKLRAILIDKKEMNEHIQGLLLALFDPEESFMSNIEQQAQNETVYFKISGQCGLGATFMEFYFAAPSEKIVSDFGLKQQIEKQKVFQKNFNSSFLGKICIPLGLLAILTVWYFKYKH